jgi:predicted nucleic acid-binding protein
MILFDTNILVYVHNEWNVYHQQAYQLEADVLAGKIPAALSTQNLVELYSTITHPTKILRPLPVVEANKIIRDYLDSPFKIIYPNEGTIEELFELTSSADTHGGKIFDVFLVATMLSNNVDTIYTNNEKDFLRFKGIKVINPFK